MINVSLKWDNYDNHPLLKQQMCLLKSVLKAAFLSGKSSTYPHVLFEDVCSSLHFYHTVDDQLTVGSQEVSPLVQSFNLYCLVVLLPI